MSQESVKYSLNSKLGSYKDLSFYFDFLDVNLVDNFSYVTGSGSDWTGVFENQSPNNSVENYYATATASSGISELDSSGKLVGFLDQTGLKTYESNLQIPLNDIDLSASCFIVDFSFDEEVQSGIIFGAYEKEQLQLPDLSYVTGAKGFNVGVTERGHLFVNAYSKDGDFVEVFTDLELSKRNVISFGNDKDEFYISLFDFSNNTKKRRRKKTQREYLKSPQFINIGGSKTTYTDQSVDNKTFFGHIRSICGFSKKIYDDYNLYTGFLSEYSFNSGLESTIYSDYLSGEISTHRTGIVGYGENILTGIEKKANSKLQISHVSTGSINVQEGEIYNLLNKNSIIKRGYLDESIKNVYNPTGTSAYDTLGFFDSNTGVDLYEEIIEEEVNTGEYTFKEITIETGTLRNIETIEKIYIETGINYKEPDSSGLSFILDIEDFNTHIYMGVYSGISIEEEIIRKFYL